MRINGSNNRALQRLAEAKVKEQQKNNLCHIALLQVNVDGETRWQWGGNTGEWFSPTFPLDDFIAATRYPIDIGLSVQDA